MVVPTAPQAKSRNLRNSSIKVWAVPMVAMAKYGPRSRKHSAPIGRLASIATTPPATMPIQGDTPSRINSRVDV